MKRPTARSLAKACLDRIPIFEKRLAALTYNSNYRDLFDYLGVARFAFEDYLTAASIQMKHGSPELQTTIDAMLAFADKHARIWARGNASKLPVGNGKEKTSNGWDWSLIPKEINVSEFPFGTAALACLLVQRKVSKAIAEVVPSPSDWSPERYTFNAKYFVDGGLVELLANGKTSPKWRRAVACFAARWDSDLYEPSMLAYANIIKHANAQNWTKSIDSIQQAVELWDQRAEDREFPEFQSWEGGGQASYELQTDLRLCVIVRQCFAKNERLLAGVDLSNFGSVFG